MCQYNLKNVIKDPTCFKSVENPSLIDVILTNTPERIASHMNVSIGVSDFHNFICAATRMYAPITTRRKIMYRSFKHFNDDNFNADLTMTPFHVCEMFDDIDDVMWAYHHLLNDVIDCHAPMKTKYLKKPQLPYMNGQLRKAINVKNMLHRKFLKCKDQINWNRYKLQRNLVNSLKRKSIREYFNERCNNQLNNKKFWQTVRPFMSNSHNFGGNISLSEQDKLITKPMEVCSIFNDHFINIANDLSEPDEIIGQSVRTVTQFYRDHPAIVTINANSNIENSKHFEFCQVTPNIINKAINKLKVGKACGYDKVPARILKIGSHILSDSLAVVMNKCIKDGKFPDQCKHAEVSPIYKKNDSLSKNNYRPVSVLTALSKVLESILCEQLMTFFSDVLCNSLSAYRAMYSTNNVLIKCVEEWKYAIDTKMVVGCVAMDLSRAFDSIPHGLTIAKLHAYGVANNACNLISSYLTSRKQRVKIENCSSEWSFIKRGVPQGSLMGPVLFNVYLNDLLLLLQNFCQVHNYADDNTLSFCHHDVDIVKHNLERSCTVAIKWFRANYMKVNAEKFQFMVIGKSNQNLSLCIDDIMLKPEESVKLLGVLIDNNLNFKKHIGTLLSKAAKQINVMGRLSKVLTVQCKLRLLDAFIMSTFNYCCMVYHNCTVVDARKMENLLKRALRFVYLDFTSNYKQLLCKSERVPLYVSRLRTMLITVYKIRQSQCPPIDKDFFVDQNVPYVLRNSLMLVQPMYNTSRHGYHSLRYQGAMFFNKLNDDVKTLDFNMFKNYVSRWQPECSCGMCLLCTI